MEKVKDPKKTNKDREREREGELWKQCESDSLTGTKNRNSRKGISSLKPEDRRRKVRKKEGNVQDTVILGDIKQSWLEWKE